MTAKEFQKVLDKTLGQVSSILGVKAKEYATSDRLHNFKQAGHLQNLTPEQALAGMMVKHTVSLYDMIQSEGDFPIAKWDEKIVDHINYLLLLKALVVEKATDELKD